MPVELGKDKEGCFARWGKSGAKYHYTCGNEDARNSAKQKAYKQGLAITGGKLEYQETYSDYPKAASENAKTALRWAEENGWGDCGTPVGKARANQLANGEGISRDTIARMAAFERHRQNSKRPLGEGCGRLMWLAWGGDEGVEWAQRKLQQIDRMEMKENLKTGDAVSWKTGGQNPRGRIREVVKSPKTVPGTDFILEGTEDDPGYIIEIYEEVNGQWKPSGKFVGRKGGSILKNVRLSVPVKKA